MLCFERLGSGNDSSVSVVHSRHSPHIQIRHQSYIDSVYFSVREKYGRSMLRLNSVFPRQKRPIQRQDTVTTAARRKIRTDTPSSRLSTALQEIGFY